MLLRSTEVDMYAETLEEIVGMRYECKVTLISKQPGKVLTDEMTVGEFFGNTREIPILLYYMHKL